MTMTALRSRMGAAVKESRLADGEIPDIPAILRMTARKMAEELEASGRWKAFAEHYLLVRIGDDFYDRDGKVD